MYLTPEQKIAGRQAFANEMMNNLHPELLESRREFLVKAAAAGVVGGGALGCFYYGYGHTLEKPVRVAVIGTGDEGNVLIGGLNPNFYDVKAIADIRPYSIHRAFHGDCYSDAALKARPGLMKVYGWKTEEEAKKHVKVYQRYEDLLKEEKDVEAVIIALPLHLHAVCAIQAMLAGKHVLTEKLMAQTVTQCKEMGRVAKTRNLLLAVGHQRHYNILYDNAKDTIKRGVLGDLHYIRAQWHRGNMPGKDSWSMPLPPGSKGPEKPGSNQLERELKAWLKELNEGRPSPDDRALLERKIAQKQAQIKDSEIIELARKEYGYTDLIVKGPKDEELYNRPAIEELIRWRLWNRTSAGMMAELGSHQLDAASIFIAAAHGGEKQIPLNVVATGNRPIFPPDREVEDHICCIVEFPAPGYNPDPKDIRNHGKRISVQYASINGNVFGGYGEMVFGTKGTLAIETEKEAMLFKSDDSSETKVGVKKGAALDTQASGMQTAAVGKAATMDVSRGYAEELEHFAWCIRNPSPANQPHCGPKVAMGDAIIALTTNMAAREGKRIEFKPEWFDINKDDTPEGAKPDVSKYKPV